MYAIAGVTGNTGAVVADEILQQGKPVRVIVRTKDKGRPWLEKGAEVVVASVDDPTSLAEALRGADGAYLLAPPDMAGTDVVARGRELGETFAAAIKESGIAHVVFLSSIGAHLSEGTGPIQIVHHIEKSLRETGVNLTLLRPAYFIENWAAGLGPAQEQGVLPSFLTADAKVAMVATRDIGKAAADALLHAAEGVRILAIAGPQEYAPADVATELGTVLGKEVKVAQGPLEAVVPTFQSFGISEHVATQFRDMYDGLNAGRILWDEQSTQIRGTTTPAEVFRGLLGQ
jgi:uncharacterized protein YbjT (DUF2867 family)